MNPKTSRRDVLKGIGSGAALIAMGGVVAADDDTDDQGDGTTAEVRVGHLSPDAPEVFVEVESDGEKVATTESFEYPTFFPGADSYLDLEAGTYDITTKLDKDGSKVDALSVENFELEANKDYTLLATGELNPEEDTEFSLGLLPLVDNDDDDTALPPADAALARLVHASPDAGEVDLVVEQNEEEVTTIENVSFRDATDYLELPPGDYTIDVGPGALSVPVTLEAGTKVSGYVIGNATTEDEDDGKLGAVTTLEATNPGKGRGGDDKDDDGDDDDDDDEDDGDRGRGDDKGRGRED